MADSEMPLIESPQITESDKYSNDKYSNLPPFGRSILRFMQKQPQHRDGVSVLDISLSIEESPEDIE